MKKDYPLTSSGYFGEKGKNARVIKTNTPEATSTDFYNRLGDGGKSEPLSNGKGTRTTLPDGSIIVHRLITSTPGSPAVDIKVIGASKVKSHNDDYDQVFSIEDVKEAWSNDGENTVDVKRTRMNL